MQYFDDVVIFILGACIGSFLNVCIYRIPRNESVVYKPSHCPNCGQTIGARDLVPIFSYMVLKGRCRYCSVSIPPQYPLVELVAALLFLAAYRQWGVSWQALSMIIFFAMLIPATVIDIYHQIIPHRILIAGSVLGIPCIALNSAGDLAGGVIGFLAAGLLMLAIAVVSGGGMGGGDVKLSAVMGLFLGWAGVGVALFIAFLLGGLVGIYLMLSGRKGRKDAVPFGPFLAFGGLAAAFYADKIINWYLTISGF